MKAPHANLSSTALRHLPADPLAPSHVTVRRALHLARWGLVLATTPMAVAEVTVTRGEISVGADFAAAPINLPPAGASSLNGLFASADLSATPSGSFPIQGPAAGWAGAGWNFGGTTNPVIFAGAASIAKFNGAYLGPQGFLYGFGHSDFEVQLSLNQAYRYTAETPTSHVSGVSGDTGIFLAGNCSLAGSTYGNSGGYSVNLKLSPLAPAEQDVLAGVNLSPTISLAAVAGGYRHVISADFSLSNTTLAVAAAILGGDHFNWQQRIISVPDEWQITINGDVVKQAYQPLPLGGLVDPPVSPSAKFILNAATGFSSQVDYSLSEPDGSLASPNGRDYFSDQYARGRQNATSFHWEDSPSWMTSILRLGESVGFETQLVLEDANGNVLQVVGQPIDWFSDQTSAGSYLRDSTLVTQGGLEPADGGGIYLGHATVPEPGSVSLLLIAALGLIPRRRRPSSFGQFRGPATKAQVQDPPIDEPRRVPRDRALSPGQAGRATRYLLLLLGVVWALPVQAEVFPTEGLIGYWSGNRTAADSSPIGNHGSFGGSYVAGRSGGDAAFDLATAKVTIPDNPAYDFHSYPGWTVGFWFNTNGLPVDPNHDTFLGQDNGSGFKPKWFIDYGYTVFGPNNSFVWHVNDFNTERIFLLSDPVTLPLGWNQLTVVVDTSAVDFYLNGLPIGVAALPSYVLQPSAPLVFGQAESLNFNGLMNDVAIFGRALSAPEVAALVSSTAPEPSSAILTLLGAGVSLMLRRSRRAACHSDPFAVGLPQQLPTRGPVLILEPTNATVQMS